MLLIMVRPAVAADVVSIQAVEQAADALFATVGVDVEVGDDLAAEEILAAIADGRAWVATEGDRVVGSALAVHVDGEPHLLQLSVHPDHGRRGHGRHLVEAVVEWAGADRLTLTTFRDVPFNAPFYERLGFVVIEPEGPELRAIATEEAATFADPRVCMARATP